MKPLAVVYRPQTFEDVVEQDTIKKILQNQIDSGTVKNAYLFCGSAGCGKTTNAYLFARYLNGCNDNITDLDAASHSGVDDVRSIIEDSRYKPIGTPYRIFIIDEAHALSDKAWQAFLLTLEEPTPTSIFVFCLDEDGLVTTKSGQKRIKDVIPGDFVWTGSAFNEVGNVFNNGKKECLKITLSNGSVIRCTPNHKIKVLNGTHEVWKDASEISVGTTVGVYHSCGCVDDANFLTDTECWFLGYLTGNGHYRKSSLEFFTPNHKLDLVHSMLDIGVSEGWLSHYKDVRFSGSVTTRIHMDHGNLVKWYNKTGCNFNYTRGNKEIPKCVYSMSKRQFKLFVSGWYDADGNKFGNNFFEAIPHPQIICASEKMSQELHQLLIVHGYDSMVHKQVRKNVKLPDGRVSDGDSICYSVYLRHQSGYFMNEELKSWMLEHTPRSNNVPIIKDARKLRYGYSISSKMVKESNLPDLQGNKWYFDVVSIENCGTLNVYDIEVPEVHEFIYGGIKVHNCTTDPQKIPATILSRAQRFDFQKITQSGIVNRLKYIIKCENEKGCDYTYTDDALEYIAKLAEGGMRSAITFMETAMGLSKDLTIDSVVSSLGTISYRTMFDLTKSVCRMDKKESIQIIETAYASGTDLKRFIRDFSDFVLDLCKYDLFRDFEWLHIPPMYKEELEAFGKEDYAFFTQLLNEMLNLSNNIKYDPTPKPTVESVFILLCSEA